MLPPIKTFKPRVKVTIKPAKAPSRPTALEIRVGVRGNRITLKQKQRVAPQPLAVPGENRRGTPC